MTALTIKHVKSTKEIPYGVTFLAVRSDSDAEALKELEFVSKRDGKLLTGTVYAWGAKFYYAEMAKK